MSPAPIQSITPDPKLQDLLLLLKKDIFLSLNCHALATIESFDSENQTVVATMNYSKTYYTTSPDGAATPELVPYPVLVDMPIIILGGGSASLTFPISKGDQCMVLFNDRDIDNWFSGATSGPVNTNRLHSFADGIALIGLNDITNYDTTRALLKNGDTKVGLSSSKVLIENSTRNLNTVLQELISVISGLTTIPAAIGVPLTLSPATIAQLNNVATELGELLE